ncbi:MAG: hypothetical protein NTZ05_09420, partial [Chloroflexi bacterium]|nr:hypothetical protein [Chloroflexota bacterium]
MPPRTGAPGPAGAAGAGAAWDLALSAVLPDAGAAGIDAGAALEQPAAMINPVSSPTAGRHRAVSNVLALSHPSL